MNRLRTFFSSARNVGTVLVLGLGLLSAPAMAARHSSESVRAFNRAIGKGLNLGNLLEVPSEGAWGIRLVAEDFPRIASKGFQSVRVPIRWDGKGDNKTRGFDRALRSPPYTVDPRFFARIDSVVNWARREHLVVVLNDHHHDTLFQNYEHEAPRFMAIWEQIAEHYKDLPTDSVAFEILNEPNGQLTSDRWNFLLDTTLKIIRRTNPTRPVVVGTANWGGPGDLAVLTLPIDSNLILTVHDYDPMTFAYQGASWTTPAYPVGVVWGGYWDRRAAREGADAIAAYAKEMDIPVYMGEFGTTVEGDSASRKLWAASKCRLYEQRGFSWAWWDYDEPAMGLYRPEEDNWDETMLRSLFSTDTSVLALGSAPVSGQDLIVNGQFDGATGWFLVQMDSGNGTFTTDSGYALTSVRENPLREGWAVEICQKNLALVAGQSYELSFTAWADTTTTIDAWVGHGAEPWDTYAATSAFRLERTPKSFATGFQMAPVADSLGEVCINLGTAKAQVRLDSVKLTRSGNDGVHGDSHTGSGMRLVGRTLLASSPMPLAKWLVDVRGAKVFLISWKPATRGWSADLRGAPSEKLLFLDRSGLRVLLND